jgi:hypothetical protein
MTASFLHELKAAAEAAKGAEAGFRREAAMRIAALEQERAFAFRRLNLMQALADAVQLAESEEIGVATALAALRARLGWVSDSETRSEILARFGPVAQAVCRAMRPGEDGAPAADVGAALEAFENWYRESRASPFWTLFEQPMQDTPVVDF